MSIFQKRSSNINKLYKNIIFTPKNPRFFTPKMGTFTTINQKRSKFTDLIFIFNPKIVFSTSFYPVFTFFTTHCCIYLFILWSKQKQNKSWKLKDYLTS